MRPTREQVIAMRHVATFRGEIAEAKADGEKLRITVAMNSFDLMYSRRLMHPAGYREWLSKRSAGATLPMLAQHGFRGAGFASIGKWDKFEYDEQRGALWSGWIGGATQLARDAQALAKEGTLDQVSWGWDATQTRYVKIKDADLDPYVRSVLQKHGEDECYVFIRYEPYEGSLVDIADDRGARRVAEAGEIGELRDAVDRFHRELKERLGQSTPSPGSANVPIDAIAAAVVEKLRGEFTARLADELVPVIESCLCDPRADYAEMLVGEDADALAERSCGHGHAAAGNSSASVQRVLPQMTRALRRIRGEE